jgi:hypothetical protein
MAGMDDGKDGGDVVQSITAASSEHEGFTPTKRFTQPRRGENHIGIGGGEFLGRMPFIVKEFHEV